MEFHPLDLKTAVTIVLINALIKMVEQPNTDGALVARMRPITREVRCHDPYHSTVGTDTIELLNNPNGILQVLQRVIHHDLFDRAILKGPWKDVQIVEGVDLACVRIVVYIEKTRDTTLIATKVKFQERFRKRHSHRDALQFRLSNSESDC